MKPQNPFVKFLGFAPDSDPTIPGVLTDTTMMVAATTGLKSFPATERIDGPTGVAQNANFSVYPQGYLEGFYSGREPTGGSGMVLVKTWRSNAAKYYALRQSSAVTAAQTWGNWEDVTPTDTSAFSTGPGVFARMGEHILIAGGEVGVSAYRTRLAALSTTGGIASNITGAPAACIVVAASRFAVLLNYTSTAGTFTDGWHCSARDDHTNWIPAPETLCAFGRLVESDGPITAGMAFGDDVLAFKMNSFYLGRFVPGDAEVWHWDKISSNAGARGPLCVCADREGRAYMLGTDDLYVWDGAQVRGLMGGVLRDWFLQNFNPANGSQGGQDGVTHLVYDPVRELIVIAGRSVVFDYTMTVLTFCPRSGLWAKAETSYEMFGLMPHRLTQWPSYSALCALRSSSSAFASNSTANRYLHEFSSVTPAGGQLCGFTTGDYGDDFYESELKSARVRDIRGTVQPANRKAKAYHRANLTETLTTGPVSTAKADGAFDVRQSNKWHRLAFEYSGHAEVTGVNLDLVRQGAK